MLVVNESGDAAPAQVSTHNLERVRRIKNRMVRLNTRVETIHELLEKLLDDDDDMKDLNLTAKQLVGPLHLVYHAYCPQLQQP